MAPSHSALMEAARRPPGDPRSAADCIVEAVSERIERLDLPSGARLPSIRRMAQGCAASRHAVVDAYDRLAAHGYVVARPGAGVFVAEGRRRPAPPPPGPGPRDDARAYEVAWLIREVLEASDDWLKVGGPWLPDDWLDIEGLQQAVRALARGDPRHLVRYGPPLGYPALRHELQGLLAVLGVEAGPGQILTTGGSSHAFDLIVRTLIRPGDAVLVEDPGYYNLFAFLRFHGARLVPVPRGPDGPDAQALRRQASMSGARLFFTQTALQNPTGSDTSPAAAYRLLEAARELDLVIIEDDTYADVDPAPGPRLASLDQLQRVIYLRSFSKTLSGSLRVGFIAASQDRIDAFAGVKILSSISTSQFAEKVVCRLLADGRYARHLRRVRTRIGEARARALALLRGAGMEVFVEPRGSNFLWARFPGVEDAARLAPIARSQGVILGLGAVFRPNLEPSPWMRFNVALCGDPRLARFVNQVR